VDAFDAGMLYRRMTRSKLERLERWNVGFRPAGICAGMAKNIEMHGSALTGTGWLAPFPGSKAVWLTAEALARSLVR
jgi:hypothetical protein